MKYMTPILTGMLLICFCFALNSQNTVGVQQLRPEQVYPGYNLIYPHNQPNVYLLDACGQIVHSWTDDSEYRPGNAAYILPDGKLVKTKRHYLSIQDPIWAGGGGAIVEIVNWDNQPIDRFEQNDSLFRLHHDIAPMPNGNVLMIVWEKKTEEEAIAAGRDPDLLPGGELWSEAIWEWDPTQDSIVWRWSVWDHLVQDQDAQKDNFGIVADHPELININYDEHDGHKDWLHMNAIDYNPVLDQIAMSVPYFNEMWIIDHSTTPAEAAGHNGGNSGKGGDLLFRWGNPQAFDRGTVEDKQLFFQHDVNWVNPTANLDDEDYGWLAVYNNRTPDQRSPGHILITQPTPDNFNYPIASSGFAPDTFHRTVYYPTDEVRSNSVSVSSVQFLPNGNALMMAGRWGFAYELNPDGEVVWQYIVPLLAGMPVAQGEVLGIGDNLTFRIERYAEDYPGFANKDLDPKEYLESSPNEGYCDFLIPVREKLEAAPDLKVFPNPAQDRLRIEWGESQRRSSTAKMINMQGRVVQHIPLLDQWTEVDVSRLPAGIYFLQVPGVVARKVIVE